MTTLYSFCLTTDQAPDRDAVNATTDGLNPASDFPISVTLSGRILSVFSDDVWDMTPYANRRIGFRFADDRNNESSDIEVANKNKLIFKLIVFWSLYAMGKRCSLQTTMSFFQIIRKVVRVCNYSQILLTDLSQDKNSLELLSSKLAPTENFIFKRLFSRLLRDKDLVGFLVFDADSIDIVLDKIRPRKPEKQTQFIPERIYFYIVDRCLDVINGYLGNEENIRNLFKSCTDAYSSHLAAEISSGPIKRTWLSNDGKGRPATILEMSLRINFEELANDHGAMYELQRVYGSFVKRTWAVRSLGYYLHYVRAASRLLITALTGMRKGEVSGLKSDCLDVRDDPLIGKIYLIRGTTTKTINSNNAAWVAAPEVEPAIRAAISILGLQNYALSMDPRQRDVLPRFQLFGHQCYLWTERVDSVIDAELVSGQVFNIDTLLDSQELVIDKHDYAQSMRVNTFQKNGQSIGDVWKVSSHQFRRTVMCLALGAGVSLPALSWQAKHSSVAMTLHYGRNYFNVESDPGFKAELETAEAEIFLMHVSDAIDCRYVSPNDAKDKTIKILSVSDSNLMQKLAKSGKPVVKKTLLGFCVSGLECRHGGWEDVASCVACDFALLDRSKETALLRFQGSLAADIDDTSDSDIILHDSLVAQKRAVDLALRTLEERDDT